jgi:hypothetical protein
MFSYIYIYHITNCMHAYITHFRGKRVAMLNRPVIGCIEPMR